MCYSQIWQNIGGDKYLCKLGKEYSNASLCKCVVDFFTAFWNFWRITRLSTTNHRRVINAKTGPVFLAHPVHVWSPGLSLNNPVTITLSPLREKMSCSCLGSELRLTYTGRWQPCMNTEPRLSICSLSSTNLWRSDGGRWIPLCSKSNRNSSATRRSMSSVGTTSLLSSTDLRAEKITVLVLSVSTRELMLAHAWLAAFEYSSLGWATRTKSAMSATRHRQSDRSSNTETSFRFREPLDTSATSASASLFAWS